MACKKCGGKIVCTFGVFSKRKILGKDNIFSCDKIECLNCGFIYPCNFGVRPIADEDDEKYKIYNKLVEFEEHEYRHLEVCVEAH